ncbi:glycosyltransferase family 39 protein [uncultured Clostridium sp.]|uniref:glycosyltransferase family 39 protein n=1 Tax=uncultured Clostridium sp. TaxID=59620 RepID=UPI00260014B8|nr:glycosyltransferase family 39 protein [uncultured Clostridium sp.]
MKSDSLNKSTGSALNKFGVYFTNFVVYSLLILFLIVFATTFYSVYNNFRYLNYVNISLIVLYLVLTGLFILGIHKKVPKKKMFIYILTSGFIMRLAWAIVTKSTPVSDFLAIYEAAGSLLEGDTSAFKGLGYFARFPHNTTYILLFSVLRNLFGNNALFAMKIINVLLSTVSIALVYLICNKIFKDYRKILLGTFFISILPSAVLYTPVYCSENIAIPFYLASIYLFILVVDKKNNCLLLILSGLLLCIGHLFRMVAYVVLIAYIMYILIYNRDKFIIKMRNILFLVVPFIILLVVFSNILIKAGITERNLWDGSEPSITSAVRGSNIESGGSWNPEDAEFIDEQIHNMDKDSVAKVCKERILKRYTTTPPLELGKFFIKKIATQWAYGDDAGAYWSEVGIEENDIIFDISGKGILWYQLVYAIILLFIMKGLFNKGEHIDNKIINLFYIILCGFGAMLLILENQCRYAYIINYVFAILPVTALKSSSDN